MYRLLVFSLLFTFFLCLGNSYSQNLSNYYPKDAQTFNQKQIEIKWNALPEASSYLLYIDTSLYFNNPDSFRLSETEYIFSPDSNQNQVYYFYIKADSNLVELYSDTNSFMYFDPKHIPGLSLWTRADKGVDTLNSKLRKWKDQSGNQNDLQMSTTSKQPTFYDKKLNDLPSVFFDATDDGLNSPISIDSNDYMMSILYNCHDLGNDVRRTIHGSNNWLMGKYVSNYNIYAGGFTGGMAYSPFEYVVQTAKYESGVLKNYINSNFKGSLTTTTVPGKIGLGSWSGSNRTNGEVSEWLVYKSTISDSLQFLIEKYVMDKYAPAVNLGKDVFLCSFPYELNAYKNHFTEYEWSNSSTDSIISISTEGFYKLKVKDVFGRFSEDSIYIKLDTLHSTVQLPEDSINLCKGETVELKAGVERYGYNWNTGDTTAMIEVDSTSWYVVEMKNCRSESSTDSIYVQIHHPKFSLGSDTSICFYNSLDLLPDTLIKGAYLWSTSEINKTIKVDSTASYSLQITDVANCSYSDSIFVELDSNLFGLDLGADTALCSGNSIAFESKVPNSTSFLWSTGSTDSSIVVDSSQSYSVSLSLGKCSISDSIYIEIKGLAPKVDFTHANSCFGDSMFFADASTSLDTSQISEWYWDFGDGSTSTEKNPKHSYDSSKNYRVSLSTSTNVGCISSFSRSIKVFPKPKADFETGLACAEASIEFSNKSKIAEDSIQSYSWNFGTADSLKVDVENPVFWYDSAGTYQVSLEVISDKNCKDTMYKNIQVHPAPQLAFTFEGHCLGDSSRIVNLSSVSAGSIVQHEWNLGNSFNSNKKNPSTFYTAKGDYVIYYRATTDKNCRNYLRDTISIYELPKADFIASDFCEGEAIKLIDNSSIQGDSIISYRYIFNNDDTSFMHNPSFGMKPKGSYAVNLMVESSHFCRDSVVKNIEVRANPIASFNILNNHSAVPLKLKVENHSKGATKYYWYFGNSDSSLGEIPNYTYNDTGIYKLKLKVQNEYGCEDSMIQDLFVKPAYLDAGLSEFYLEEKDGMLKVSGRLLNMGSVTIENLQLRLSSNNEIKLMHEISAEIFAGKQLAFEFQNSLASNENIDYLCLEIVDVNGMEDERTDNNRLCKSTFNNHLAVKISPNPVSSNLKLEYVVPQKSQIEIKLFDYSGREIKVLLNSQLEAGYHQLDLNVLNLSTGIYFLKFLYKGEVESSSFIKH